MLIMRDIGLLPSVDCSPPLLPVGIAVVLHTAIFVGLGLVMRYFLEAMWLQHLSEVPTVDKIECSVPADPIVCGVDRVC